MLAVEAVYMIRRSPRFPNSSAPVVVDSPSRLALLSSAIGCMRGAGAEEQFAPVKQGSLQLAMHIINTRSDMHCAA